MIIKQTVTGATIAVLALSGCGGKKVAGIGTPKTPASVVTMSAPVDTPTTESSSPSPVDTGPTESRVGGSVGVTQTSNGGAESSGSYRVNSINLNPEAPEYETPKGKYIVIDVTVVGTTGAMDYNPFDFTLQTSDDRIYQPEFAGFEPQLQSGSVKAGQKARGNIVFDIPKAAKVTQVQLNGGSNGVIAVWSV